MHNILSSHLQTLLHKHSCVILPGFGGFVANYKSATIDTHTDFFTPPSLNIAFNQALTHNDGLLIQEIAKEENISLDDAEKQLFIKINLCRKELYLKGRIEFDGIGLLYLDSDYKIQFKVALKANLLPQSYGLRSFRFASTGHRKLTQSFEKQYMNGTSVNRRIIISSVAAASVIVFISLALFINGKLEQNHAVEASVLPIDDTVQIQIEKTKKSNTENETNEISTKKSLALNYTESHKTNKYHIVAGSFTNKKSAEKFAQKMKKEGYTPTLISEGDKIRVSIFTYDDRYEALTQLDFMRVTKDKTVWLLEDSNE